MNTKKQITLSPYLELIGVKLEEVKYPRARLSLQYRKDLVNPMGTLHGGVISSLVDAVLGCALLSQKEIKGIATLELKVNYLNPVTSVGCSRRRSYTEKASWLLDRHLSIVKKASPSAAIQTSLHLRKVNPFLECLKPAADLLFVLAHATAAKQFTGVFACFFVSFFFSLAFMYFIKL